MSKVMKKKDIRKETNELADFYGYSKQSRMLTEECAELIQAVNKHYMETKGETIRQPANPSLDSVIEEMADVLIMMTQVQHLLHIEDAEIRDVMIRKIERQKERINKEKINGIKS